MTWLNDRITMTKGQEGDPMAMNSKIDYSSSDYYDTSYSLGPRFEPKQSIKWQFTVKMASLGILSESTIRSPS